LPVAAVPAKGSTTLARKSKAALPGQRDIHNIKRADMKAHFNALQNNGSTV
jgi:hypothetical protein